MWVILIMFDVYTSPYMGFYKRNTDIYSEQWGDW